MSEAKTPATPTHVPPAPAMLAREAGRRIFGDGAAGYHGIRMGYPDALFDHLVARAGVVEAILEIGPGSGLATEPLLARAPRRYVAVESDPSFVAFLRQRWPGAMPELICAPFPSPGLAGPFDLAVCAAAFHWLDPVPALAALRDLLRPGGVWGMWWNSYLDEADDHPFARAAMALLARHGIALPPSFGAGGHHSLDLGRQTQLLETNGFAGVEVSQWRRARPLDGEAAVALFDSFSFVRVLAPDVRHDLLTALRNLVGDRFGGVVDNIVSTTCYSAHVR